MTAAAQTALDQEESFGGWALSTATSSGIEPAQRQRYAITEPLVAPAEPVYRPPANRSCLALLWTARVSALELPFSELVSQYAVTRNLAVHSSMDDPQLNAHWAALWWRPSQPSLVAEEEMLDWDVSIKTPTKRRSTTVLAAVEYRGRAKPRPFTNPWD